MVPTRPPGVAPGIIPLPARFALGVGRRTRTDDAPGGALIVPGTHPAGDDRGGAPARPDEIAGGSVSEDVRDARGFENDLVAPRR